jgi:hypothetical protein
MSARRHDELLGGGRDEKAGVGLERDADRFSTVQFERYTRPAKLQSIKGR